MASAGFMRRAERCSNFAADLLSIPGEAVPRNFRKALSRVLSEGVNAPDDKGEMKMMMKEKTRQEIQILHRSIFPSMRSLGN